ncbi:MAG: methyltransferase domain-containing protein [Candidatus Omnitrophica bacterium]|nr:methyltransferase domain-containing protein [Candidatus Omnitrophota bacterium]
MSNSEVYNYPAYYALGYRWNTEAECDFIEACVKAHGPEDATRPLDSISVARGRPERATRVEGRLLDIGCGAGRHLIELAKRGFSMTGVDLNPEMIAYVQQQAQAEDLTIAASVDDLRHLSIRGTFDAAYCVMDTFRFLLTSEEIVAHLQTVARLLAPGGLYLLDFWVPRQWDQIGNEVYQWEQTEGETTVRVFYLQHPETADPIAQTFEDELVFEVEEGGETKTIRGGPTRTRLILPQEFRVLVEHSGAFALLSIYGDFHLTQPLTAEALSWRMISVLKKR